MEGICISSWQYHTGEAHFYQCSRFWRTTGLMLPSFHAAPAFFILLTRLVFHLPFGPAVSFCRLLILRVLDHYDCAVKKFSYLPRRANG